MLLVQVTSSLEPLGKVTNVNCLVSYGLILTSFSLILSPTIDLLLPSTLIVVSALVPSLLSTIILALPTFNAVTLPKLSTVNTLGSLLI